MLISGVLIDLAAETRRINSEAPIAWPKARTSNTWRAIGGRSAGIDGLAASNRGSLQALEWACEVILSGAANARSSDALKPEVDCQPQSTRFPYRAVPRTAPRLASSEPSPQRPAAIPARAGDAPETALKRSPARRTRATRGAPSCQPLEGLRAEAVRLQTAAALDNEAGRPRRLPALQCRASDARDAPSFHLLRLDAQPGPRH